MPRRDFHLKRSDIQVATVVWRSDLVDTQLLLDGELAGVIASEEELRRGEVFELSDGTELGLRLGSYRDRNELLLHQNGIALRPIVDEATRLRQKRARMHQQVTYAGVASIALGVVAGAALWIIATDIFDSPIEMFRISLMNLDDPTAWIYLAVMTHWLMLVAGGANLLFKPSIPTLLVLVTILAVVGAISMVLGYTHENNVVSVAFFLYAGVFIQTYTALGAARDLERFDDELVAPGDFDSTW